jgi:hypothetical protein
LNDRSIWLRVAGTVILMVTLVIYEPGVDTVLQNLMVPLLMALGALALVQNLAAVALGSTVLATIHTDFNAASWVSRIAYPVIAVTGGSILLIIAINRFRARIAATRAARWADRRNLDNDSG